MSQVNSLNNNTSKPIKTMDELTKFLLKYNSEESEKQESDFDDDSIEDPDSVVLFSEPIYPAFNKIFEIKQYIAIVSFMPLLQAPNVRS